MSNTPKLVKAISPKKTKNNNKTVVVTVLVTLGIIVAFVATFIAGVKWANTQHNQIQAKASEIASQTLKSSAK